jgi:hypothetical protein
MGERRTVIVPEELPATEDTEESLVARLAMARRAGEDTAELVDALLRHAAARNRAALDRLAK